MPRWSQRASAPASLLDMGEEGDDVVLDDALDLVDARRLEHDVLGAERRGRAPRPATRILEGATRRELDLEPDVEATREWDQSSAKSAGV